LPVGYVEKVVRTGVANELTLDVNRYLRDHMPLFPNFTLPEREFGNVRPRKRAKVRARSISSRTSPRKERGMVFPHVCLFMVSLCYAGHS
jgi:hypothetical protein